MGNGEDGRLKGNQYGGPLRPNTLNVTMPICLLRSGRHPMQDHVMVCWLHSEGFFNERLAGTDQCAS